MLMETRALLCTEPAASAAVISLRLTLIYSRRGLLENYFCQGSRLKPSYAALQVWNGTGCHSVYHNTHTCINTFACNQSTLTRVRTHSRMSAHTCSHVSQHVHVFFEGSTGRREADDDVLNCAHLYFPNPPPRKDYLKRRIMKYPP